MNILIVDDEPMSRKLLFGVLEAEGHRVFGAADGLEALEVLAHERCDAMISDILMPRMDGYRLCQEMRRDERFHLIPIILYSATYTSPSDAKFSLDLGADRFLRKPALTAEILTALTEATNSQRRDQTHQKQPLAAEDILNQYSERLVSRLEQTNVALGQSEARFSTIFRSSPAAMSINSAGDGRLIEVNDRYCEFFGYSREELIGRTAAELKLWANPDDRALVIQRLLKEKTIRGLETRQRCKSGEVRDVILSVELIELAGESDPMLIWMFIDITERKLAEANLKEQAGALARSNAELQQFNRLAAGREQRALEIKIEVNKLCLQFGQPERYDVRFLNATPVNTAAASLGATPTTTPENRRILVIDDNPSIHDDFRKILAGQQAPDGLESVLFGEEETNPVPFDVDCAAQGEEGLKLLRQAAAEGKPYGLAFVDVRMAPGWDGVETARRLWEEYPDLQIVLCTAYSDYSWAELRKSLGQPDQLLILKKPFDVIEVVQLAHTLLEKWRLGQDSKRKLIHLEEAVRVRTREIEASRLAALNMMADAVEARASLERTNQALEKQRLERERAGAALLEAEEKYRSIFENSAEGIFQTTPDGRYLDANPATARILGYESAQDLIRERTDIAGQGYVNPAQRLAFQQLLTETSAVQNFECEVYRKDRRKVWISSNAHVVRNERGETVRYEGSFSDISERKRLEDQLRQAQKMEAVGQLAGGIAHDFNNLLMVINGYSNMLLDSGHLSPADAATVKEVYLAGERAANLTRQLLTFSRRQTVQMRVNDLDGIVDGVTKMLQRIIGEDIRLLVRNSGTETPILADAGMIEQVLMNLVVNGRDAMSKGGCLTIQVAATEISQPAANGHPKARVGKFASLVVKDTGCGMSEEVLTHIFEPFFTTKPLGKGTGMGLATVFGIVDEHQGWVEVATEVGVGTTFTVLLPLVPRGAVKAKAGADSRPTAGGKELVLMVEDEETVRALAVIILKKYGYRVLEAASGPEALEVWKRHGQNIDLLITDMVMPGDMTGRDLTEKLKETEPDLKVVYTSGYSPDLMRHSFGLMSNIPFLQKPYTPTHLVNAVRECLDARQEIPPPAI